MTTLTNWALRERHGYFVFSGNVYDHPRFPDGHLVTTSAIVSCDWDGRRFKTGSREYWLVGPPEQEWVDWCKKNGYNYVDRFKDMMN